jgi:predicted nuclease of predicted toxin-antitoxin system
LSIKLYFDHNMSHEVARWLRRRSVDVLTAYDDGRALWSDPDLLDRATELERVIVTHDHHFLVEGTRRQREGVPFSGIIFVHSERVPLQIVVNDLDIAAKVLEPAEIANHIEYLPL